MLEDEARKWYSTPHLIADAKMANEIISFLTADITDLRMEVQELEVAADLYHNKLMQQEGKPIALKESEYKISDIYKEWKKQAGLLSDYRVWRRHFELHADMLWEQEKYSQKMFGYKRVIQ